MATFSMKTFMDAQRKKLGNNITMGTGTSLPQLTAADFMTMPKWWVDATATPGLPYGRVVMLAGDTDSGKTSAAIQAMKAAQEQDHEIIYVETENKTTSEDMIKWGVDPDKVGLIADNTAEFLYKALIDSIKDFKETNPTGKLLVIIDSMGNVISQRSSEMDLIEDSDKPGEKGKINRMALEILVSLIKNSKITLLLINYTYDNMGYGHGKTNAGGKGPSQLSSLIYQTQKKQKLFKTVKGEKISIGAEVIWTLTKNHLFKDKTGPHKVIIEITSTGMEVSGSEAE